ncbi:hypothetical protein [Foetidibacter luteolus]|uniref:hypothetical protein n=1 Tax=Foetidibacter luteolus TaxID=2608880 RepID=UPI00129BACFE|nr:hypothetical protein [Foetidibacter luteolus]
MKKPQKELTGKELAILAKKASDRAWNENFALGLPIVIEENGNVVKKYKDGKTEVIKKTTKS